MNFYYWLAIMKSIASWTVESFSASSSGISVSNSSSNAVRCEQCRRQRRRARAGARPGRDQARSRGHRPRARFPEDAARCDGRVVGRDHPALHDSRSLEALDRVTEYVSERGGELPDVAAPPGMKARTTES